MSPRKNAVARAKPPESTPITTEKKWAEPYRPVVRSEDAGFEMGENKITQQMVFTFAGDPGDAVKDQLKHYGYIYRGDQKAWMVNATSVTREIARRLADEFVAAKSSPSPDR